MGRAILPILLQWLPQQPQSQQLVREGESNGPASTILRTYGCSFIKGQHGKLEITKHSLSVKDISPQLKSHFFPIVGAAGLP